MPIIDLHRGGASVPTRAHPSLLSLRQPYGWYLVPPAFGAKQGKEGIGGQGEGMGGVTGMEGYSVSGKS